MALVNLQQPKRIVFGAGALQKAADDYTYELAVTGEIDVATGGTVRGNPASWPGDVVRRER